MNTASSTTGRRDRNARGAVTAELALVLPLLVAVTTGLVWLLAIGADQLRAVDAARETARALARGDAPDAAIRVGEQVAPDGASVRVTTRGGEVYVTVTGEAAGPGGIFDVLPPAQLHAEAVAVIEEGSP
ncbi:MAG: TadE family type IV pilus minor pilin [Nocardioides sp.]